MGWSDRAFWGAYGGCGGGRGLVARNGGTDMTEPVKALTLRQPYASLVAHGIKTIETRSWRTGWRGWLAIHAGMRRPYSFTKELTELPRIGRWVVDWGLHPDLSVITNGGFDDGTGYVLVERDDGTSGPEDCLDYIPLHLGAVVAVARLTDCVPMVEWRDAGNNVGREVNTGDGWQYPLDVPDLPVPRLRIDRRDGWALTLQGPESGVNRNVSDQLPYGDYTPGRWAWMLDEIHPLAEPVPARGKQSLWRPDAELAAAIAGQMPEVPGV